MNILVDNWQIKEEITFHQQEVLFLLIKAVGIRIHYAIETYSHDGYDRKKNPYLFYRAEDNYIYCQNHLINRYNHLTYNEVIEALKEEIKKL